MRFYNASLTYIGLTGEYTVDCVIDARNEASARKKALCQVGNRDLLKLTIKEQERPVYGSDYAEDYMLEIGHGS